ncbi:hypothetical protein [Candidatus Methylacidiphilum infernorum]|uniref:Uncharacterized protein n=1 Tax=Methylacidiphilum infernorum (isolate V4) TaxID=481448 RepID=B3DW19_METI4|nr:hypothetical protein [Candidatus Methylacidiphilum infernorum]ACD83522.1 Hypothetical protein Minf_1468 [Methylacidiphilum infernorum V4]
MDLNPGGNFYMKNIHISKTSFFLIFFFLGLALAVLPLQAQHEKHKKAETEQQTVEEKEGHEGHKMEGMDHGMMGHGMGGMGHGMMGGAKGGSCCGESGPFDQVLKEVAETKNPKATARKLRMKADLMKALAEVYEKYAKELESSTP